MAYDIGPKIGIDGEAQFRSNLKNISQQIKTLGSEMDVVTSSFLTNEKSMDDLVKQQSILEDQIAAVKDKMKLQAEMAGRAAGEFGATADKTLAWERALNNSQTELNKLKSKLSDVEKEMDEFGNETEDVEKNLKDAGDAGLSFGDILKANVLSDAIMSGVRALGSAVADMARSFVDFAKGGVEVASDLEEVQNVVDTTFGSDGAAAIDEFAKSAASSFGMSELSAKQFTGTMGAMLSSMGLGQGDVLDMSTALAGLAGDMASFYNLDPEEAFAKLRSGISGETEPLKQLGINMSVANLEAYALAQGIETAYKDMTQAEQATLRYNYIMEATAAAQGDFAKTSDSYANQQRILQLNMENLSASIGEKLMPSLSGLTTAFNDLLSGKTDIQTFVGSISDIVLQAAEGIITNLPAIMEAGGQIFTSLFEGLQEMFPTIVDVAGEIIGTLLDGLITGLPDILQGGFDMLMTLIDGITSAIPSLIARLPEIITTIVVFIAENLPTLISAGGEILGGIIKGLFLAIPELIKRLPELIMAISNGIINLVWSIMEIGVTIVKSLWDGIKSMFQWIDEQSGGILTAIVDGIKSGFSKIKEVGKNIISGLWEGIKSMGTWIKEKVSGLFDGLVGGIKDFLGIHSPSRVFAQIGEYAAAGLGVGFEDKMKTVSGQIEKAIPTPTMEIGGIMAGAVNGMQTAMAGLSSGGTFTFNLVLPDGTTLARYQLPALIDVAKSNGTPILNPT